MRRLLFLALLALAAPAAADPVSIISLGASLLSAGGYITLAQAAWIAVAAAIYGTVDARRKARKAQAAAKAAYNASLEDRSVTVLSAEAPWQVCYGRAIYGGAIVAILTSDKVGTRTDGSSFTKADALKHIVVVVAAHEVQAINEVYVDGVALGTLDGSGYVTGGEFYTTQTETQEVTIAAGGSSVQPYAVTVLKCYDQVLSSSTSNGDGWVYVDGTYTVTGGGLTINNTGPNPASVVFTFVRPLPSVRVQKHLGTSTQTADAVLLAALPTEWLSTDRLRGLAYVVVTLDLENQRFQGGPPAMTFDVSGRLLYDPRTGLTAWSDNPALCARDFIVSEWGLGCASGDVDDSYTNAAANACDVAVELVDFNAAALATHFATAGAAEGWTTSGATLTVANGVGTLASSGADPILRKGSLSIAGSTHKAVRVRFKRNAGSGWDGAVFYTTSGHGESFSFFKAIAQPTYGTDGYAEATWDMSALSVGGTNWTANTITGVRIDLGSTSGDSFDIDWIVVGPLTSASYTCNGVVNSGSAKEAVLQDLAECMGGYITYSAKWAIQAGAWTASVMDLTDDDLHGQIEVSQGGAGMDEVFNTVRGTYVPASGWAAADFDVYSRASYVTADGATLYADLQLPFTDNKARAKNLAALFVERNRLAQVLRYPAKLRAWPLQVGDRVRVTSTEYGLSSSYYRVTDWQFSLAGAVELALQQDAAVIYDPALAPTANTTATSGLPNPWVVAFPTGLAAASSGVTAIADGTFTSRVRVTWAAITDPYLVDGGGFVLIRWRRILFDPVNAWQAIAPIPASEIYGLIENVRVGDALLIEVRFENSLGARSSPAYLTHIVIDNSTGRPAAGATADLVLLNGNGMTIAGNSVSKTGGAANTWDSSVYSRDGYTGGAFVSCSPPQTSAYIMLGLNTDPTTDNYYASIDYAWYMQPSGVLDAFESNVSTPLGLTYAAGDVLAIVYDGVTVKYVQNGTVRRSVAAAAGLKLYLDSSFYTSSGALRNLRFGPLSAVTGIDTGQIVDNAATVVATASAASTGLGPGSYSVVPISYNPPAAGTYEVILSGRYSVTTLPAGATLLSVWFSVSGAGSSYGDANPQYSLSAAGQVVQVTQALTLILTGGGPWQIDVSTSIPGLSGSGTMTNLTMRVTQIKK